MGRMRRRITYVAARAEDLIERVRRRRRHSGPVQIVAYRSYGTPTALRVRGRVLEDRGIRPADAATSRLRNIRDTWRRFGSRELAGALLRAEFQGQAIEISSDDEGYFSLEIAPTAPLDEAPWQLVRLELVDAPITLSEPVRGVAEVLIPAPSAAFGLISDIDDTILQTYATDLLKMMRLTMLRNAHTRLPFEGVAELYRALERGAGDRGPNPIFYVSSSPWNLYDFLVEFIAHHGLPAGPLFLTDYGLDREKLFKQSHSVHKLTSISQILEKYPQLPFLLIGDSGQHDPEIYLEAARRYPGRIQAIYIRHVSNERRADEVAALISAAQALGVIMLLASDSAALATHALASGLIAEEPAAP